MVKRDRSPDSGGTTEAAASYNIVYIDTNIDTHFATIMSHSETISDLIDQIELEHERFFPEIGVVKVHAVKIKRNEIFYYLPDYMLLKSAFERDTTSWFLSVDVSKCNDTQEIVRHGTSNLLALDQGHLHDDSLKMPCAVDRVQAADVQNRSSSKREYNIPASNQEFKDDNVPNDVSNVASYSSGHSVETCNSAKKLKRKHNSLRATSVSKDKNMLSQALYGNNLHFETGNTVVNKPINEAGDMLKVMKTTHKRKLSTVDDTEMRRTEGLDLLHCKSTVPSASLVTKEVKTHENSRKKRSKISRSGVQDEHVDRPGLEVVAASDNHCGESTIVKGNCSSKADVRAVEKNLFTKTADTDEGTEGVKSDGEKKIMKVQKSGAGAKDQENQESIVADNDLNLEQVPEKALSTNSACPDVPKALDVIEETKDGKATDPKKKKQKTVATVQDTGNMYRDADQTNYVGTVEQNPLTKTVDIDEAAEGINCVGKKKNKKVRKSGAGAKYQQNRDSIVAENDLSLEQVPGTQLPSNSDCPDVPKALEVIEATEDGKATDKNKKKQKAKKTVATVQDTGDMYRDADHTNYVGTVEQNPLTKTVDIDEATEGINCVGKKKNKKVRKSGAGAKDQQNRDSIVAEDYLNLEEVPETQLSSNSDYPDLPEALEVSGATEDWRTTEEKKKKQKAEKAVARVKDTGGMKQDTDEINDIRDVEQNLSTKSVDIDATEGVNCGGDKKKKKVRKSVAAAKDQENQESIVVENDLNLEKVPEKGLSTNSNCPDVLKALEVNEDGTAIEEKKEKAETAVAKVQDTDDMSRDANQKEKNTPPMESPLNQVSAELENQKDREVSEYIGKEISFKQYFVPNHPQDEVAPEQSADSVTKKKRKEVIPSEPKLQQKFSASTKKDSIVSSAGNANNLAESNRVTKTKKKTGKRVVPYATTSSDLDEFRTPAKPVPSAFLNSSDATTTVPRKKQTAKSLAASGINSSSKTNAKPPLKSNIQGKKESSLRPNVTTGKNSSSKLDGEVVNKSKQQKILKQTPKAIFRDESSESSLGENGSVNSSASTGTPSDLSSSSDLSDDAATNGRDSKAKGGVKKSVYNSEISGQGHISIGTILRSSSRFKKAKDTASQRLEDPDSQLDEFLPEMQLFP